VRRVAPEASGLLPRSLADLPVIGALASGFSRARRHPLLHLTRPHLGVDVAAPRGTRVSAPAPGRVQFVGRKIGFGLVVELDHGHGVTTRYAHLRSSAVEVGEQVTKGEAIAAVGTSGITTGPHLHYEVLVRGRQVDPLRYRFPGEPAEAPAAPAVPAAAVAGPAAPASGAGSAVGTHEAPAPMAPVPGPR
jgi:murein DD-endopeptidase MepM/ murein hydrolase activator NlpD